MPSAALALALALPLFLFGAVDQEVLLATLAVTLVAGLVVLARSRERALLPSVKIALVTLGGAWLYCCLQLVPLPPRLLHSLSPRTAEIWATADHIVGTVGRWHCLSLDPPATEFAAATAALLVALFVVVSVAAASPGGAERLTAVIAVIVIGVAVIALSHPLLGLTQIYGVRALANPGSSFTLGPLINPNHTAAVLCVGPPLMVGKALERNSVSVRLGATLAAAVTGAAAILTLSRGGMAVLAGELLALGVFAAARRTGLKEVIGKVAVAFSALAAGVGAALYVALRPVLREATDTDAIKLHLVSRAFGMSREFAWFGVGRGAFGAVFPAYEGDRLAAAALVGSGNSQFAYAESWPAQWACDLGIPVALAIGVGLTWSVARAARHSVRSSRRFGVMVALIGLVVHDLADFSLEFAGVGGVAVVLLALVTSTGRSTGARSRTARSSPPPRHYVRRAAFAASILGASVLLYASWNHTSDLDAKRLAAIWAAGGLDRAEVEVHASIARHPAEPFITMLEGVRHLGDAQGGPILARSVVQGPWRAQSHFWLARWFARAGRRGQAYAEYREALRLGPALGRTVLGDLILLGAPTADIAAVAASPALLEQASLALDAAGRHDDAAAVDLVLTEAHPPAISAALRRIGRAKAAHQEADAIAIARMLVRQVPNAPEGYLALCDLEPDPVAAEAELVVGLQALGDDADLLEALVRRRGKRLGLAAVSGELDRLRTVLAEMNQIYRVHALMGEVELARGHVGAALSSYLDAAAAASDGTSFLRTSAELAESSKRYDLAIALYERLGAQYPNDKSYQDAIVRIRNASGDPTGPAGPGNALALPLP